MEEQSTPECVTCNLTTLNSEKVKNQGLSNIYEGMTFCVLQIQGIQEMHCDTCGPEVKGMTNGIL